MEKTNRRRTSRLTERNPRLLNASSAVAFSLCPGLSFRLFGFSRNSRRNPTPNTAPTAMCVELTGSPSRSEEHTSELQSLMRISYAVFCLKKKKTQINENKNKYTRKRQLQ